jgi:hypothetical protein
MAESTSFPLPSIRRASETIREHLDEMIGDLTDQTMTHEEAERTARREFGNNLVRHQICAATASEAAKEFSCKGTCP